MNSWPENTFTLAMGALLLMYSCTVIADENEINIQQVPNGGDDLELTITQEPKNGTISNPIFESSSTDQLAQWIVSYNPLSNFSTSLIDNSIFL